VHVSLIVEPEAWPVVTLPDGSRWAVSPRQVGPLSLADAVAQAEFHGCELPSPDLVDAVHAAADAKLSPARFIRVHDGSHKQMASPAVLVDQAQKVAAAIAEWERENGPARLVSGPWKDVVRADRDYREAGGRMLLRAGQVGLYGWLRANGTPVQPPYGGHSLGHVDYSQGLRLVRRIA
jgi:hypothetical protein